MALTLVKPDHITGVEEFQFVFLIGRACYHTNNTPHHLPNLRAAVVVLPRKTFARRNDENLRTQFSRNFQFLHIEPVEVGVGKLLGLRLFDRSEEHTSELQSLIRISYAVLCLNKTSNYKY